MRFAIGFLWLMTTSIWLFLFPGLHLWCPNASSQRRKQDTSTLNQWAYDGIIYRIASAYVLIWLGLLYLWGDKSICFIKYGALVLIAVLSIRGVFMRFFCKGDNRRISGEISILREEHFFSSETVKNASLGPCSEESKAELSEEIALSLWYGGLNGVYVRKFRGAGRWLGIPFGHTPPEYLRAWASDNPHLRAFAYYSKSMLGCFALIVVLMLNTSKNVMIFVGFWDEDFSRIPSIGYD